MTSSSMPQDNFFADPFEPVPPSPVGVLEQIWAYLSRNSLLRNFNLRVHKFTFQWDLVLHLFICISSLTPFLFTGRRIYSSIPIGVWLFYNVLFLIGPKHADVVVPGFGKLKHSFKSSIEDFFSPKLLPVLSVSFLLVALSLSVTGHRLGGPPLCYRKCGQCLSIWEQSVSVSSVHELMQVAESEQERQSLQYDSFRVGCGYVNGKELLAYYTMAQTSFLLFLTTMIAMAVCLAWRVAEDEREEHSEAEQWLQRQDLKAATLRNQLVDEFGRPASAIRPEGGPVWVFFGIVAALTFTLLGWHNWYLLPPSHTATLLIVLNLLTILMSTLILHLGFFGRLLALYSRNYNRVARLTTFLARTREQDIDSWWNCRNFVLNEDLSIDYDTGGLAVSATFLTDILVFIILLGQIYREGHMAMLEAPGSYCAYACMYITSCLIKVFTLATNTYEEQHLHISGLMNLSSSLSSHASLSFPSISLRSASKTRSHGWGRSSNQSDSINGDDEKLLDDGPIDIDEEDDKPAMSSMWGLRRINSSGSSPAQSSGGRDDHTIDDNLNIQKVGTEPSSSNNSNDLDTNNNSSSNSNVPPSLSMIANLTGTATGVPTFYATGVNISISTTPRHSHSHSHATHHHLHASSTPTSNSVAASPHASLLPSVAPVLSRSVSHVGTNMESYRQTIAEIISQIRKYDPYPCILGIPVMPALFTTCKFYIFICFVLIGSRTMVSCFRQFDI